MFSATKVRAKITEKDPVFKVKYIGCIETFVPNGPGCTNIPVQKLWDNAGSERSMKRTSVLINTTGILLTEIEKKQTSEKLFSIENISFCNADSAVNDRIFAWICKDDAAPSLVCHAVLCSTKEKAKAMSLVLSRAFQIAYKEWKMSKTKMSRESKKQEKRLSDSLESDTDIKRRDSENETVDKNLAGPGELESNGSVSELYANHMVFRKDSQSQTEVNTGNHTSADDSESVYAEPVTAEELADKANLLSVRSNGVSSTDDMFSEQEVPSTVEVQADLEHLADDTESCVSK